MIRTAAFLFMFAGLCPLPAMAENVLHISAKAKNNRGDGSKKKPFKNLAQAVDAIHENHQGAMTLMIHPGTYNIDRKISLNKGTYARNARLIVRASILPDDPRWTPAQMPVITSSENPGVAEGRGEPIYGFSVEVSHVGFQGLRFMGNPALGHRYYPIRREENTQEDLWVSQCIFEGDREKAPIQVGVIARGHGMVVEHCIFKACRNPTVFWQAEGGNSYQNAFRYCIAVDSYQSGLWTTDTSSDFEFHNNVLVGGFIFHMHRFKRESFYSFRDSYIVDFKNYQRLTTGPGGAEALDPAPIIIREHRIFRTGDFTFDNNYQDGKNRRWLHLTAESTGFELHAGLFKPGKSR